MKKISLLAIFLIIGDTAAGAEPTTTSSCCPKPFQGFGLKGIIGYNTGGGRVSSPTFGPNDRDFRGVGGGLGVDYTHRIFCNWAPGIGFDALWSNAKGIGGAGRVKLRNSLQLYGRLGYVIKDIVMPYAGLGWDNSAWRVRTENRSQRKRLDAFLWKGGVDLLALKCLVLGIEYTGSIAPRKRFSKPNVSWRPQNNLFAFTAKFVY